MSNDDEVWGEKPQWPATPDREAMPHILRKVYVAACDTVSAYVMARGLLAGTMVISADNKDIAVGPHAPVVDQDVDTLRFGSFVPDHEFANFFATVIILGEHYDAVAPWWVADRPPDRWPDARSVLGGVLVAACRLFSCAVALVRHPPGVISGIAKGVTEDLDPDAVLTALRCEAAALNRSPAAPLFWNDDPTYEDLRDASTLWFRNSEYDPTGKTPPWPNMSMEEKQSLVHWLQRDSSEPASKPGRPTVVTRKMWEEANQLLKELGNWAAATKEYNRRHSTQHTISTVSGWGRYLARRERSG